MNETNNAIELYNYALKCGIVNLDEIAKRKKMDDLKKAVLAVHKRNIWTGADGRLRTHIYKNGKRKLLVKATENDLIYTLADIYGIDKSQVNNAADCSTSTTDGRLSSAKPNKTRLVDLYGEWIRYRYQIVTREDTARRNSYHWKQYYLNEPLSTELIEKPIKDISTLDVEVWAKSLVKKYNLDKRAFYNMSLPLRDMLRYAAKKGLIDRSPMADLEIRADAFRSEGKPAPETQVFTDEEVSRLIANSFDRFQNNHCKGKLPLMIPLLFMTGLRLGEITALQWDNIFPDHIHVCRIYGKICEIDPIDPESWSETYGIVDRLKKGAPPRDVLITPADYAFFQWIRNQQEIREETSSYVITGHDIAPAKHGAAGALMVRYCHALGITPRSAHKARKTYVSRLIDAGINIDRVRRQAGHKSERTTLGSYCFDRRDDTTNIALLQQSEPVLPVV